MSFRTGAPRFAACHMLASSETCGSDAEFRNARPSDERASASGAGNPVIASHATAGRHHGRRYRNPPRLLALFLNAVKRLDFTGRLFLGAVSWAGHPRHVRDKSYSVPRNIEAGQRDRQGHTPLGVSRLSRPSIPHCDASNEHYASHGLSIRLVTTDAFQSSSQRTPGAGPSLTAWRAGPQSRALSFSAKFSDSRFP